ncbi:MAG: AMP-binding protein [Planctomycetota bacterium]
MSIPLHGVTLGELLDRLAAEEGEREALVYPDRDLRLTFAALSERADELALALLALGIAPGERVTVWADNRPEWVPLMFALARIGAVLVTANVALQKDEIGYLLRQSRSSAVLAPPGLREAEYFGALAALRDEGACPELRHYVALEGDPPEGFARLDELVGRGAQIPLSEVRARTAATGASEPANIQYTSGTTGFPKGVVLTHRNVVENGYAVGKRFRTRPDDRLLLQVPLFHCFGCVISVLGCYTHGASLVALQRFDPLRALEAIAAERTTLIHGVPTMFLALLEHEERARFDTSSLRAGAMGGSMCPEALMHRVIDELHCPGIVDAYGLTEASPAVTLSAPDDPVEQRTTTGGRPIEGVELRIVDPATGEDAATGERGEVWARGPNIMLGYFEKPQETAEALTPDGWLRTGDLGTLEADGLLRIVGRIKELIIRGGENVYPAEVEDALRAHTAVRDAAVFGVPSERLGEEVEAALVLQPDAALDEDELHAFLDGRLATFKRPRAVHVLDALPLTPSGKVKKFVLRERFADS